MGDRGPSLARKSSASSKKKRPIPRGTLEKYLDPEITQQLLGKRTDVSSSISLSETSPKDFEPEVSTSSSLTKEVMFPQRKWKHRAKCEVEKGKLKLKTNSFKNMKHEMTKVLKKDVFLPNPVKRR